MKVISEKRKVVRKFADVTLKIIMSGFESLGKCFGWLATYHVFTPEQLQEYMKQIQAMAYLLSFNNEEWLRVLKMTKAEWIEQRQHDYSNLRSDSDLIKYLKKS